MKARSMMGGLILSVVLVGCGTVASKTPTVKPAVSPTTSATPTNTASTAPPTSTAPAHTPPASPNQTLAEAHWRITSVVNLTPDMPNEGHEAFAAKVTVSNPLATPLTFDGRYLVTIPSSSSEPKVVFMGATMFYPPSLGVKFMAQYAPQLFPNGGTGSAPGSFTHITIPAHGSLT